MIRGILAAWAAAFGAAAMVILAFLSVPPDERALGQPIPEAEVYFIGTSLIGHAVPPYGTGALYEGMDHIRLFAPGMREGLTLDLAEAAVATARVKVVAIEAYPFVRDFNHVKLEKDRRGVLEEQANTLVATALSVHAAVRTLDLRFGFGSDPMLRFIAERPVELPRRIREARLQLIYPLHIRPPSDMQRLKRLVDTARSRGVEVWLLAPPRSELAATLMGLEVNEQLSAAIEQLARSLDCKMFAPAKFWPNHLFRDQAHLNIEGRTRFLAELRAATGGSGDS